MSQARERLERLIADELGTCCDEDVEVRLDELERLGAETSVPDRDRAALLDALDATREVA